MASEVSAVSSVCPSKVSMGSAEGNRCSICLQSLEGKVYSLGCAHIFHEGCIQEWQKEDETCPFCNFKVLILSETNKTKADGFILSEAKLEELTRRSADMAIKLLKSEKRPMSLMLMQMAICTTFAQEEKQRYINSKKEDMKDPKEVEIIEIIRYR